MEWVAQVLLDKISDVNHMVTVVEAVGEVGVGGEDREDIMTGPTVVITLTQAAAMVLTIPTTTTTHPTKAPLPLRSMVNEETPAITTTITTHRIKVILSDD